MLPDWLLRPWLISIQLFLLTPYLNKLGAALQSSNLYAAQHFGLELQNRGGQLQSNKLLDDGHQSSKRAASLDSHSGIQRIDLSA